jgi:hypothetical protein
MKLEYIFSSVLIFYLKVLAVFGAYHFAKIYSMQNRSSTNPPLKEKLIRYTAFAAVVAGIALISTVNHAIPDEDDGTVFTKKDISEIKRDYGERQSALADRRTIIFLALIFPTLIGVNEGFSSKAEIPAPRYGNDDWD